MGESSCLFMHSSSPQDHGIAMDSSQRIRHQLAFEGSVTFGRFASESLSWEKWSAFSHNRVMEEVAKYSTPGSVAQKKAYFEAHFKGAAAARKAAAFVEQEKTVVLSSICGVDPMGNVGAESLVEVGTVAAALELSPIEVGDAAVDMQNEVSVSNVVVQKQDAYFEAHYKQAAAARKAAALLEQEKTVALPFTCDVDPMENVGAESVVGIGTVAAVDLSQVEVGDTALDLHKEVSVSNVVEKQDMDVDTVVEEQNMDVNTVFEDSVDMETLPVIHTMPELAVEESCTTSVVFEDTFHRSDQNLNDEECSILAATGAVPLHRPDLEPLNKKTVALSSACDVDPMENVGAECVVGVGTVAAVDLCQVEVGDAAIDLHTEVLVSNVVEKEDMDVEMGVEDFVEEQYTNMNRVFKDSVDVETLPVIHTMPELSVEESCSTSAVFDDTFHRSDQNINDEECSISAATGAAPLHRPDLEPLNRPDQGLIVEESSKLNKDDRIKEKKPKLSGLRSCIGHMISKLLPSPSKLSTPTLPRQNNCGTPAAKRSTKGALEKGKLMLRCFICPSVPHLGLSKKTLSRQQRQPLRVL